MEKCQQHTLMHSQEAAMCLFFCVCVPFKKLHNSDSHAIVVIKKDKLIIFIAKPHLTWKLCTQHNIRKRCVVIANTSAHTIIRVIQELQQTVNMSCTA